MTELTYLSVCSGIEAATVAWHPLGWLPVAFAEIEAFPRAVLAHHYPSVPNWGDITRFKDWPDATVDVLVGGTPCQSFSVAGLRAGLADPRGNLALTYLAIADRYRPQWLVWENVPGVLSSDGGRDFGSIVGGMVELGYSPSWRVLDAQYVRVDGFARAVPQRRRRVFVVGHLGDWRRSAAVLFEPESLQGNTAPRRQAGQGAARDVAPSLGASGRGFERAGDPRGQDAVVAEVAATMPSGGNRTGGDRPPGMSQESAAGFLVAHALRADGFDAGEDGTGRGTPLVPAIARTLTRGAESSGKGGYAGRRQEDDDNLIAAPFTLASRGRDDGHDLEYRRDGTANAVLTPNGGRAGIGVGAVAQPLRSNPRNNSRPETEATMHVLDGWAVRRLTPTECERLQGFPDGYTAILYRGKPAADGPRYKALGNSMAVNAMRWLGYRIQMVTDLVAEIARAA